MAVARASLQTGFATATPIAPKVVHNNDTLLLRHWYEMMALYDVKSILTEISASRQVDGGVS